MRHRRRQHCCCCAAGKPSLLDTHTDAVCILLGVWLAAMALMPLARSEFVPRNFSGIGNNVANPTWGVAETTQIRSVAGAEYADAAFTPPGEDRPSARAVMTEVFSASEPDVSTQSTLFVAWGQLVTFDISLTADNISEPFDIPCDDGGGVVDVWCPLGADSDAIPFFRSDAAVDSDGVRNPINYATAYLDLDFVYGRSEEDAREFRTLEGGLMTMTDAGLPVQNADGTWLIADQRTAEFPVTFALHTMLLLEHNRCCVEVAPDLGYEEDEDLFQACRGWTIAVYQHITENDFLINLLGMSLVNIGTMISSNGSVEDDDGASASRRLTRRGLSVSENHDTGGRPDAGTTADSVGASKERRSADALAVEAMKQQQLERGMEIEQLSHSEIRRRRLPEYTDYDSTFNAAADVFATTAGGAAFLSALPATVRIVSEGYVPTAYDGVELTEAREDLAGLLENVGVGDVLRGAVLSPAMTVGTHHVAAISSLSPLFKIPVDAVQRGRDHGVPTYNAVREAYGLDAAANFSEVTSDSELAGLLSTAYGDDIDTLDAYTGALAEPVEPSTGGVVGELLFRAWADQLSRTLNGDRLYHQHKNAIEDVELTTLSNVIERTTGVADLPLSTFQAPSVTVCAGNCTQAGETAATLSDNYIVSWEVVDEDALAISLSARGIGELGYVAMGWGGLTMAGAQDYVICEVLSATEAQCTDRAPVSTRTEPPLDTVDPDLEVTAVTMEGDWTTVTFLRAAGASDDEDYDLSEDLANQEDTELIYSFRGGSAGVGQHSSANRGSSTVNFALGSVENNCSDGGDFILLHGTLMLIAWMVLAPLGIYYIRYRKGENVKWAGKEWYEMHEELMIVASEAVLPLGITAVFASGAATDTEHANWGYYMIAAVAVQILTGMLRTKALEAKQSNFSLLHRFNKHFHIWAGRFAYLAGVVQCYRGLALVAGSDNLVISFADGLDLQIGNFDFVARYVFPAWFALVSACFLYFETRKQYRRYFSKGRAKILGVVEIVNEKFGESAEDANDRLMPRTQALPIYTVDEFNDKVLNGQTWVLIDGAILDVSEFAQRHPGGRRLILNAVGTDVTQEILGQDLSVGHAMAFSPHEHTEAAWVLLRELVVGYIEEDDDEDDDNDESGTSTSNGRAPPVGQNPLGNMIVRRIFGKVVVLPLPAPRPAAGTDDSSEGQPKRLGDIDVALIPNKRRASKDKNSGQHDASGRGSVMPRELSTPVRPPKKPSSRQLQKFHICPLLFRERMGASSEIGIGIGGGGTTPGSQNQLLRPVYRYVFSCPGQAQALVQAITGVCYFNMRCSQERGKGVIQRAYNAFAVRVQESSPATTGGRRGKGPGTYTVIPARETSSGLLCIEVRVRLYHDGAMSKLLEALSTDTDNPSVQLQGPFVVQQLVPPPAHLNVVMIAAGTGVNPMVQQMRDYLSHAGESTSAPGSRLRLLWQNTTEEDFYGIKELTEMQERSNGLLEVTALISGQHRKFNVPGGKAKVKRKTSGGPSPKLDVAISPGSSAGGWDGARTPRKSTTTRPGVVVSPSSSEGRAVNPEPSGLEEGKHAGWWRPKEAAATGSGVVRGKINRDVLAAAFGEDLLASIKAVDSRRAPKPGRDRSFSISSKGSETETDEDGEQKLDVGNDEDGDGEDNSLAALVGSDSNPGKVQVVISGPPGFVLYVDNLLIELGVPPSAVIFLD